MPEALAAAAILREYQDARRGFDGIHQMMLPQLREHRHAFPKAADHEGLADDLAALGLDAGPGNGARWASLVVDGSVLLSYARLDSATAGAALVDAAHDPAGGIVVSALAYLRTQPAVRGTAGEPRLRGLLGGDAVEVAGLTFGEADTIARLNTGEPAEVVHTALLALGRRCVVGTLNPGAYHRIGYLRTLDLSA